jgi:IclR family transcriptional regulator, acetate operon repressor
MENFGMRKSLDGPAQTLHSVDNALRLLSMFADVRRLRITDIVVRLGVSAATASRLVAMLEVHGYVQKDSKSRAYVTGHRLNQAAYGVGQRFDVRVLAAPWLVSLAAETGETAQFGVLQGSSVVFLGCAEGQRHQRISSRVGVLIPAHALSTGKMLLATLPQAELAALYSEDRLPRLTRHTIDNRRGLFAEIDRVRRSGLAASVSESEDGLFSLAVAVTDASGRARGALSVAAPVSRSGEAQRSRLARALRIKATEFAAQLV